MPNNSSATVTTAALFTWHIPFAYTAEGKELKQTRQKNLQLALNELNGAKLEAVKLITGEASAPAHKLALQIDAQEGRDTILQAALRMHFAISVMDSLSSSTARHRPGRHSFSYSLDSALQQITLALQTVDQEAKYLALSHAEAKAAGEFDPTAAQAALPPEIFAAVTTTYIRAALMTGHTEVALQAQQELDRRLDSIQQSHVKAYALRTSAITYIALQQPQQAAAHAQRALSFARREQDLVAQWQAQRIRAHAATISRRRFAEEQAHLAAANLARKVADGLETPGEIRREASLSELESRSVVVQRLLLAKQFVQAKQQLQLFEQRINRAESAGDVEERRLELFKMSLQSLRQQLSGN